MKEELGRLCAEDSFLPVYRQEAAVIPDVIDTVMKTVPADFGLEPDTERGLPGEPCFVSSGWYHYMLGRYVTAASCFCRSKRVLDLCSGLGWGAYIMAHYADSVHCIELDERIVEKAGSHWKRENMHWCAGSALNIDSLFDAKFDVVTAMEAIEHFERDEGIELIKKSCFALHEDEGILLMSSYFPCTRDEAEAVCKKNEHHHNIFTQQEIYAICKHLFRKCIIIDKKMLIAIK